MRVVVAEEFTEVGLVILKLVPCAPNPLVHLMPESNCF